MKLFPEFWSDIVGFEMLTLFRIFNEIVALPRAKGMSVKCCGIFS